MFPRKCSSMWLFASRRLFTPCGSVCKNTTGKEWGKQEWAERGELNCDAAATKGLVDPMEICGAELVLHKVSNWGKATLPLNLLAIRWRCGQGSELGWGTPFGQGNARKGTELWTIGRQQSQAEGMALCASQETWALDHSIYYTQRECTVDSDALLHIVY